MRDGARGGEGSGDGDERVHSLAALSPHLWRARPAARPQHARHAPGDGSGIGRGGAGGSEGVGREGVEGHLGRRAGRESAPPPRRESERREGVFFFFVGSCTERGGVSLSGPVTTSAFSFTHERGKAYGGQGPPTRGTREHARPRAGEGGKEGERAGGERCLGKGAPTPPLSHTLHTHHTRAGARTHTRTRAGRHRLSL